jgi:large conductance mechanosensitive channel protein
VVLPVQKLNERVTRNKGEEEEEETELTLLKEIRDSLAKK